MRKIISHMKAIILKNINAKSIVPPLIFSIHKNKRQHSIFLPMLHLTFELIIFSHIPPLFTSEKIKNSINQ